jgi:hypothetical protein
MDQVTSEDKSIKIYEGYQHVMVKVSHRSSDTKRSLTSRFRDRPLGAKPRKLTLQGILQS